MRNYLFLILMASLFSCQQEEKPLDIRNVFMMLPADLIPELTIDNKSSLLETSSFQLGEEGDTEFVEYVITHMDNENLSLNLSMNFLDGPEGFINYELKCLKRNSGRYIVIYSKTGGAPISFSQLEFKIFDVTDNGLKANRMYGLQSDYELATFTKANTPEDIMETYESYSNRCYEINPDNGLPMAFVLYEDFEYYELDDSWLEGNALECYWNGDQFEHKLVMRKD